MTEEIIRELKQLEIQHNIKILYAVESGSRAWGFASKDSDWDVRYIYIHHYDWYLNIDMNKDSLEEILPNDIDLSGWELKKALRLFRKSNPPLLEWLRSPIVYMQNYATYDKLKELTIDYFNAKSCIYHYLHMAEGNYRSYLKHDLVRVKKYFYVLRPILACEWIRQRNTMAPMEFQILLESVEIDIEVKNEIHNLLQRKISGDELNEEPRIQILNNYLEDKINYYNEYVKELDISIKPETFKLDRLFKETLFEVWKDEIQII